MTEGELKKAIIDYLQLMENLGKCVFIRNNSFAGKIVQGDKESYIRNAKKGAPDILCCVQGQFIGIEIKSPTGKQTPEQKEFEKKLRKVGGVYLVVRSLEEVQKIIH